MSHCQIVSVTDDILVRFVFCLFVLSEETLATFFQFDNRSNCENIGDDCQEIEWSCFWHVNCGELDVNSPRAHPISTVRCEVWLFDYVRPLWCTTPHIPTMNCYQIVSVTYDILVWFVFCLFVLSGETLVTFFRFNDWSDCQEKQWSCFWHVNCGESDVFSPKVHPISAI